jgi:hypothetical protein
MRFAPAAVLAIAAVLATAAANGAAPAPKRVLFVGNSLLTHASIPERFARLANALGRPVDVRTVARPDFTLEAHLQDGGAVAAMGTDTDFVVLLDGPGTHPGASEALARDAKRMADAARSAGAMPSLVMAWPPAARGGDFPEVIRAHRRAAQAASVQLLPVGEAWLRALSLPRKPRLYGDAVHPSSLGADLAAITIYLSLFPAGPQEFDESFVERIARALDLPAKDRDPLLDAATRAIDEPLALR